MENKQNRTITIRKEPEKHLSFLESTLGERAWRATVYTDDAALTPQQLTQLEDKLRSRRYVTKRGEDQDGRPTLEVRKIGAEESVFTAIGQLGFFKGLDYATDQAGEKFKLLRDKARNLLHKFTENKAKKIGSFYLMGDIVMFFSGFEKAPTRVMQYCKSIYGALGATQSLVFMNWAAEADQQLEKELQRKWDQAEKSGLPHDHTTDWLEAKDPQSKFNRFMEKNAITAGSLFQILGRVFWTFAGISQIRYGKNAEHLSAAEKRNNISSGWDRIKDAVLSVSGWCLLMLKEEAGTKEKPTSKLEQLLRKNSNRIAGIMNAGSTFFGIRGDLRMIREENKNYVNLAGNLTYAGGDAYVFLTKTSDYDEKSGTHPATLAKVAARFMASRPALIGPAARPQMARDICAYLVKRAAQIDQHSEGKQTKWTQEQLALKTDAVYRQLQTHLPAQDEKLNHLLMRAAELVQGRPAELQQATLQMVTEQLSSLPTILSTAEELAELIQQELPALATSTHNPQQDETAPTLRQALKSLEEFIPESPEKHSALSNLFGEIRALEEEEAIPAATTNRQPPLETPQTSPVQMAETMMEEAPSSEEKTPHAGAANATHLQRLQESYAMPAITPAF